MGDRLLCAQRLLNTSFAKQCVFYETAARDNIVVFPMIFQCIEPRECRESLQRYKLKNKSHIILFVNPSRVAYGQGGQFPVRGAQKLSPHNVGFMF